MLKGTSNIIGLKNESAKNAKVAYRVLQNLHFNHFLLLVNIKRGLNVENVARDMTMTSCTPPRI